MAPIAVCNGQPIPTLKEACSLLICPTRPGPNPKGLAHMPPTWTLVTGTLARGYHVASGPSKDYPYGALERQRPLFKERGLDLSGYFDGTLNIDIRPYEFSLLKPEFTFKNVEWTDLHPPEHFSFSHCRVLYESDKYEGWVYYPHPETKKRNFQE